MKLTYYIILFSITNLLCFHDCYASGNISDSSLTAKLKMGVEHLKAKDYPNASNAFLEIIQSDTQSITAAHAFYNLGLTLQSQREFYSAISSYKKADRLYLFYKLDMERAKTLINMALAYNRVEEFNNEVIYLMKALPLVENLSDSNLLSYTYFSLGNAHKRIKNFDQASIFIHKCIDIRIARNEPNRVAKSYNSLANLYKETKQYRKSISYYQKSIDIKDSLRDYYGLGLSYHNLASTYDKLEITDSALYFFQKAFDIKTQYSTSKSICMTAHELGRLYIESKPIGLKKAKTYLLLGDSIAQKSGLISLQMKNAELWSNYYQNTHQLDSALFYHQLFLDSYKKYYKEQTAKNLLALEEKYEAAKKDAFIGTLQKKKTELEKDAQLKSLQIQQHKNEIWLRNILLLVILLVLSLLIIAFLLYRQKSKLKQLKANSQGQELIKQKVATDLHDSVANSLSGIRLGLMSLDQNDLKNHEPEKEKIEDQLGELYEVVRNLSHHLAPVNYHLKNRRFSDALSNLLSEFQQMRGIKTILKNHCENEINQLRLESQSELYLILNELLHNTYKHSRSNKLEITLTAQPKQIFIDYKDFGIGLPQKFSHGIGLKNIQARTEILKGQLRLKNWEHGFEAKLLIPLKNNMI